MTRIALILALIFLGSYFLSGCVGCELRDGELKCIQFDTIK